MRLDFREEVADLESVQEMIAMNDNADQEDDDIQSVDKRDDTQTSVSDILVYNYTLWINKCWYPKESLGYRVDIGMKGVYGIMSSPTFTRVVDLKPRYAPQQYNYMPNG